MLTLFLSYCHLPPYLYGSYISACTVTSFRNQRRDVVNYQTVNKTQNERLIRSIYNVKFMPFVLFLPIRKLDWLCGLRDLEQVQTSHDLVNSYSHRQMLIARAVIHRDVGQFHRSSKENCQPRNMRVKYRLGHFLYYVSVYRCK